MNASLASPGDAGGGLVIPERAPTPQGGLRLSDGGVSYSPAWLAPAPAPAPRASLSPLFAAAAAGPSTQRALFASPTSQEFGAPRDGPIPPPGPPPPAAAFDFAPAQQEAWYVGLLRQPAQAPAAGLPAPRPSLGAAFPGFGPGAGPFHGAGGPANKRVELRHFEQRLDPRAAPLARKGPAVPPLFASPPGRGAGGEALSPLSHLPESSSSLRKAWHQAGAELQNLINQFDAEASPGGRSPPPFAPTPPEEAAGGPDSPSDSTGYEEEDDDEEFVPAAVRRAGRRRNVAPGAQRPKRARKGPAAAPAATGPGRTVLKAVTASHVGTAHPAPPPRGPGAPQVKREMGRTSQYRGVSLHRLTKRWEASCWVDKKQQYLGGFDSELKAARAYDVAALACKGEKAQTNFPAADYTDDLVALQGLTVPQIVAHVRRNSTAFARGKSKFKGVTGEEGRWEGRIGTLFKKKNVSLGYHETEEEAAKQYDRALIIKNGHSAKTNFDISVYDAEVAAFQRTNPGVEYLAAIRTVLEEKMEASKKQLP